MIVMDGTGGGLAAAADEVPFVLDVDRVAWEGTGEFDADPSEIVRG